MRSYSSVGTELLGCASLSSGQFLKVTECLSGSGVLFVCIWSCLAPLLVRVLRVANSDSHNDGDCERGKVEGT